MREKPDIDSNYELQRPWVHPKDRDLPQDNFDRDIHNIRLNNPHRFDDGFKNCTFDPTTNPTLSKHKDRNYNDLLQWGDEKTFRLANERLNDQGKEKHTFMPEIDNHSVRLAGNREGAVEDRLLKSGNDYTKKLNDQLKKEKQQMFNPWISNKSRELAAGFRPDELVKKDNGQTVNVDFWEAVPDGRGDGTLYCKSLKQKRDKQKATQIAAELLDQKNKLAQSELDKKKMYDPNPMYTSPYCKELLNTDIPLKTIISRSKKVNSKNLTKFKQSAAKSKSRSKSRSKSLSKSMRGTVVTGFIVSPPKSRGKRSVSNASIDSPKMDNKNKSISGFGNLSQSPNAKTKSRSISRTLGIGKSRRKQLKDQKEKQIKEEVIEFIKSEKSKSKAKKRENGIQNLLPVDLRAKVKGFVPKDPTSPTKHRKNHCSNDKKKEDKLPLKKALILNGTIM